MAHIQEMRMCKTILSEVRVAVFTRIHYEYHN